VATQEKEKKKPARRANWLHPDPLGEFAQGNGVCLAVWIGEQCDVYEVWPRIDNERIVCWGMKKCLPDEETSVDEYHVGPEFDWCDCAAGTYLAGQVVCRHRASLRAALEWAQARQA
jgi:hypothetical protein